MAAWFFVKLGRFHNSSVDAFTRQRKLEIFKNNNYDNADVAIKTIVATVQLWLLAVHFFCTTPIIHSIFF
jgi:hypothetical protein